MQAEAVELHGYILHPKNPASLAQSREISGLWSPHPYEDGRQLQSNVPGSRFPETMASGLRAEVHSLADAIMDRLIHCSHKIHLQGKDSMRERASKKAAKG